MTDPCPARDRRFVLCMTGGSGAAYALRLLRVLLAEGAKVDLVVSDAARRVLKHECGIDLAAGLEGLTSLVSPAESLGLTPCDVAAVESTAASGSAHIDGIVICPCSMGTLARVAHGLSTNLIERAADVALKERRRLVLVPRETPLSVIHLRNMLILAEAGATILPAMPGLYHRPRRIEDIVDFVVARILDHLGVSHELVSRWRTPEPHRVTSPWNEGEE